jgi:carbon-monoxide dehydrogenase medium subunit
MKPAAFEYVRADSLDEALDALARHGDEAKLLAGGQSLVPMMNLRLARPAVVVDVNRLGLDRIRLVDGGLSVGALTRHAELLADREVARAAPVIPDTLRHIGHPTIRRRGSVGGSIAHADPVAELPALLLLLDGAVTVRSTGGERRIAAADLFQGAFTTGLEPNEIIVEIAFTIPRLRWGAGFVEIAERSGDFAIAAAGVSLTLGEDGRVDDARVVLSGAGGTPLRARAAETMLAGEAVTPALAEAAGHAAVDGVDCHGDLRASAGYRRHLLTVLAADAVKTAGARAGGAAQ